jgi:hypothetical protein
MMFATAGSSAAVMRRMFALFGSVALGELASVKPGLVRLGMAVRVGGS